MIAAVAADKAAVVGMLENVHRRWDVSAANVKVMLLDGKASVVAGADIEHMTIMLQFCVPRQCKVHDSNNEHPMAVPVTVALAKTTGDVAEEQPDTRIDFLLNPEFKAPAPTAVAVVPGGDEAEREWIYSKDQSETLHPFWAVRRITDTALQQEKDQVTMQMKKTGDKFIIPVFKRELVTQTCTTCNIAPVGAQSLASTRFVVVFVLKRSNGC